MKLKKTLLKGLAIGFITSLLVSSIMTFVDWQKNPSGIFHSSRGTDWGIVWDTFTSWFLPLTVLIIPAFAVIAFLIARKESRDIQTK